MYHIHPGPAQPIGDLDHGLRPPSGTRTQKNKIKIKIEYNLWKTNLNYNLIKSFGNVKKKNLIALKL